MKRRYRPFPSALTIRYQRIAVTRGSDDLRRTFGNTPLNDPDVTGKPGTRNTRRQAWPRQFSPHRTAPKDEMSNSICFRCLRRGPEADITNLGLAVGAHQPSVSASYLGALPVQKFEFSDVNEGGRCLHQSQPSQLPHRQPARRNRHNGVGLSVNFQRAAC